MYLKIFLLATFFIKSLTLFSQDPNFHIYICFGQSNMQGAGEIEDIDKTVDGRFKVVQAVNCSNLARNKGSWYTAVPPLCRCYFGLSPVDYFGKTMVKNLPDTVNVGVVNVSVAGCKIELFDKDNFQNYLSTRTEDWFINIVNEYDGNPYEYLVEVAKLAQQDGVIKGFLLHQGESNTGDKQWPAKISKVYNDLINDLGLNPDSVPLLAGELVNEDQGGNCASMNPIIATLPDTISNSYVISSAGCTDSDDNVHFNSAGYREFGRRYAFKMLSLMGYDTTSLKYPDELQKLSGNTAIYLEPECATVGVDWDIINDSLVSGNKYITVKPDMENISEASTDSAASVYLTFSIDTAGKYNLFAHLNCPTYEDDSFWIRLDSSDYEISNGLFTGSQWQWLKLVNYELTTGEHTLTLTYREDGSKLDKICISNNSEAPIELGDSAINACKEDTSSTIGTYITHITNDYKLNQNFPNPFLDKTSISFQIPNTCYVSLKVFDMFGAEITELAGKEFNKGEHIIEFDSKKLARGYYMYVFKTHNFFTTRKMIKTGD